MSTNRELFAIESSPSVLDEWEVEDVYVYEQKVNAEHALAKLEDDQKYRRNLKYRLVRYVPKISA